MIDRCAQPARRNAVTWKTGNSGAPFLNEFSPTESVRHVLFEFIQPEQDML